MFKVCFSEDMDRKSLSLWVRPDDHQDFKFDDTTDLNVLIRNWKTGLMDLISNKIFSFIGDAPDPNLSRNLAKAGGVFVNSLLAYFKEKLKGPLDPIVKATLAKYVGMQSIFVYIDDLDRGWEGRPIDRAYPVDADTH